MGRGLVSGLIWGAFLSIVAAALLSLGAPLPERALPAGGVDADTQETGTIETGTMAAEPAMPALPATPMVEPAASAAPETGTAPPAPSSSDVTQAAPEATGPQSQIPLPAGSEFNRPPEDSAPVLPGVDAAVTEPPQAANALPLPSDPPLPDTAPAPQPQAVATLTGPAGGQTASEPVSAPSGSDPEPVPPMVSEQPAPLGLPQIETGPEAETATAPQGRPLQPVSVADGGEGGAVEAPARAILRNAAPFDGEEETRPLMAVVLIDDPNFALGRDALMRFNFPVAFAIDPRRPDAAEAAASYRAAGFEVVLLGEVFGEDTTGADVPDVLARSFETLPEAVAVLDTQAEAIQGRRDVLEAVVNGLAETGHGLVAFPRGLNMAEQTATRAGVPAATLFREIDSEHERATVITRYLERAAFAAGQEGAVIVVGHTYSDTVTALFSWALGSRSEAVALAPLSAVLLR